MKILITGCAGTMGRAFTKHLCGSHEIIGLDNNEWAMAEYQNDFPIKSILKSFEKWRFNQDPVDLVIHCAAYKHVDLGESNPHTFIENNVYNTGKLFAEAFKHNADILFISTDKAVEPCSVYGYTKAIGEKLCKHYGGKIVRLGNVLNSNGSVIPIWEEAIAGGKTIKITDERMMRYVIEDEEAVRQIWKGYLDGKKLIIPECEEKPIANLLMDVLEKHNLTFKDVKVKYIGKRPGEKLREKLKWEEE